MYYILETNNKIKKQTNKQQKKKQKSSEYTYLMPAKLWTSIITRSKTFNPTYNLGIQ